MADPHLLIAKAEELLARTGSLQASQVQLRAELLACGEALREKLAQLREASNASKGLTVEAFIPPTETVDDVAPSSALTPLQLPQTVAALPGHSSPEEERRTDRRRKGNPVAVLLSNSQAIRPTAQAWVIDRSQNGLCLLVDEGVPVGTILSVRSVAASARARWVRVEVKSCRQQKGSAHLGCLFLNKPGWEDLRQFG